MLFFVNVRVVSEALTSDQLWDALEKETEAVLQALAAGKLVGAWKVAGQRRVVAIVDAQSHDELDAIFMAGLPMVHHIVLDEVIPVRDYKRFAEDVKRRWR